MKKLIQIPLDKIKIERSLVKKGFQKVNGDHNYFHYITKEGKRTQIFTKTSFGSKTKVVDDSLLGKMSKQCKLEKDQFNDLVECRLSRDGYEDILKEKNIL